MFVLFHSHHNVLWINVTYLYHFGFLQWDWNNRIIEYWSPWQQAAVAIQDRCICQKLILTHWGRDKMAANLAGDIFKCNFLNKNVWISIRISLKFVTEVLIYNKSALIEIRDWRLIGDKPLYAICFDLSGLSANYVIHGKYCKSMFSLIVNHQPPHTNTIKQFSK